MLTTPGQACGIGGDPVNFRRDQPQTDPSHHISRIVAALPPPPGAELGRKINGGLPRERRIGRTKAFPLWTMAIGPRQKPACRIALHLDRRERRRGGKEGGSTCRIRWGPLHTK